MPNCEIETAAAQCLSYLLSCMVFANYPIPATSMTGHPSAAARPPSLLGQLNSNNPLRERGDSSLLSLLHHSSSHSPDACLDLCILRTKRTLRLLIFVIRLTCVWPSTQRRRKRIRSQLGGDGHRSCLSNGPKWVIEMKEGFGRYRYVR